MGQKCSEKKAWDVKKNQSQNSSVRRRRMEETVHLANLMDPCRLQNAELAKQLQKYHERVVLWRDNVQDEEGYRAAFAEQDASASQMKGAKFLDTISKRPGMARATSDAISAYTQVRMTEAPRLLRLPEEEGPEILIRNSSTTKTNNLEEY